MGPLFPIAFPDSLRAAAKACFRSLPALSITAAGLFVSCISDGPNRTGGAYLDENGVVLENPLYEVHLKDFPVDSFWTVDAAPSHLDDSILLLGRKGAFTAETRLAYLINDTAFLDSLSDSASSLRLSLSTPTWKNVGYWTDNGDAEMRGLADPSVAADSLSVAVLAWDLNDSGLTSSQWSDSLSRRNRRHVINGDTTAILPPPTSIDTIRLKVAGAYEGSALQARALPALKATLAKAKGNKHSIQLRLIPLPPAGPADTLPAMLRLGGQWAAFDVARMPLLLFGRDRPADSLGSKNRVPPAAVDNLAGVSYTLRYAGPRNVLVAPLQRGLHLTFDRGRLLDSLDSALARRNIAPRPRSADSLSLAYFVPFAAITLPIDSPTLEAGLPVRVRLISAVDTLLGDTTEAGSRVDRIPAGGSLSGWTTSEQGDPRTVRNQVKLHYDSVGSMRRVILSLSKDSILNDTLFLPVGGAGHIQSSLGSRGNRFLQVELEAGKDTLIARSYLSARAGEEPNGFRDPATGKPVILDSLVTRYVHPGDDRIRLRATGGMRALLNRANLGSRARQEFEFQPSWQAYNPKAKTYSGDTRAAAVQFPLLSVIPPRIVGGALTVNLDLYLYPLRER